jgi:hypothetical protein
VTEDLGGGEPGTVIILRYWQATHLHDGVIVLSFDGPPNDLSEAARTAAERAANASRRDGIEADRRELGVVAMEQTLAAWQDAFDHQLRLTLVSQVLSRPVRAIDANRQGLMVDGRMLAGRLDQRSTLLQVLASREFQRRVQRSWHAFVADGDARLAQVAHRRLFGSDATEEHVALLRDIASRLGFAAFVAALLYSDEYTTRYGNGLPGGGAPVIPELEKVEPSSPAALPKRSGTRSSKSRK